MKAKDSQTFQIRELLAEMESRLVAQERPAFSSHRLCASDLAILARLQKKGPKAVNQLALKVGLTSGSMSTAVQRLCKRELITTHRDEQDGRKVWVKITKTGKQTLRTLTTEREELVSPLLAELSGREGQILIALLKKIRKSSRANS